jgi:hypothetical protein
VPKSSNWRKLRACEQYLGDTQGQGPRTLFGENPGPRKLKAQEEEVQGPRAVIGGNTGSTKINLREFRALICKSGVTGRAQEQ